MIHSQRESGQAGEDLPPEFLLQAGYVVAVQLLSHVRLFATQWTADARLPCPSLSPGVCLNSNPLSQWCHPTISASVTPFSSCPQSFPASGSYPMNWLFISGGQSTEVLASASASVFPMNIQGWFPLGLTDLIPLLSKRLSRVFSSTTVLKHQFFITEPSLWTRSHISTQLLEKPYPWLTDLCWQSDVSAF